MFHPPMSDLGIFHGGSNKVFAPISRGFTLLKRFNYFVPKRASPSFKKIATQNPAGRSFFFTPSLIFSTFTLNAQYILEGNVISIGKHA